jgi:hypothetical protein
MKSYIKIYGPPILKAIKTLETVAVGFPEVCIMDTVIAVSGPQFSTQEGIADFFGGPGDITVERCSNIISNSGESLGEYDFFFEWFVDPTMDQLNDLIEKVDNAFKPLKCLYTITTKR